MMRKFAALALAVLFAAEGFAGTIYLENYDYYVYRRSADGGGYVPSASNWKVVVFKSSDATIGGGDGWWQDPDDAYVTEFSSWNSDGYFTLSFLDPGGGYYFARVFNSSDVSTATHYVNLSYGTENIGAFALETDTYNWDPGGSASDGSDWLAVPEPATMSLYGLGMLTMAFAGRRKLFKKK